MNTAETEQKHWKPGMTMEQVILFATFDALKHFNWVRKDAAKALKISQATVWNHIWRLEWMGIHVPDSHYKGRKRKPR